MAALLLAVGIAIAYDAFFAENLINKSTSFDTKNLNNFSIFIKDLSQNFPVQYGVISIIFAIVLGVSAAFIRRFFSDLRKKYMKKA